MRWLALWLPLAAGACETAAEIAIPADHPCPDQALTPPVASLWEDHAGLVPLAVTWPLQEGVAAEVTQGWESAPTHQGVDRYALDLAAPVGTVVYAPAPGVVVTVRDDSGRHGPGPEFQQDANFIVVDHGGGLYSNVTHLAAGSAQVAPGDWVEAHTALAQTGLSGRLTGPHLHVHIENAWSQSVPAGWVGPGGVGCDHVPAAGDRVVGDGTAAGRLVARDRQSPLPSNTFARFGVAAQTGLPGRLLGQGARHRISGRVAASEPPADRVGVLLFGPEGGEPVGSWVFAVDRAGGFVGTVDLAGIPVGSYGLAASAAPPGEAIRAPSAVRVSVW